MIDKTFDEIQLTILRSGLHGRDLRALLDRIVHHFCTKETGALAPWSPREHGLIEDAKKFSGGAGIALLYTDENDEIMVLMAQAGPHYPKAKNGDIYYMIPGGFMNAEKTEGSSHVPANEHAAETPQETAAREGEEEIPKADGTPLFRIDPASLRVIDTTIVGKDSGNPGLVLGLMAELTEQQVADMKDHLAAMKNPEYRATVAGHTANKSTGLPEVIDHVPLKLKDLAMGKHPLLHPDQQSLFIAIKRHYDEIEQIVDLHIEALTAEIIRRSYDGLGKPVKLDLRPGGA